MKLGVFVELHESSASTIDLWKELEEILKAKFPSAKMHLLYAGPDGGSVHDLSFSLEFRMDN